MTTKMSRKRFRKSDPARHCPNCQALHAGEGVFCGKSCANLFRYANMTAEEKASRSERVRLGTLQALDRTTDDVKRHWQEKATAAIRALHENPTKELLDSKRRAARSVSEEGRKRQAEGSRRYQREMSEEKRLSIKNIISKSSKRLWRQRRQEMYDKAVNNATKSLQKWSINKTEAWLLSVLPKCVKFVGYSKEHSVRFNDGKIKMPDFVVDGTNKVIELFGDRWHEDHEEPYVISGYAGVGIKCFVVWSSDLKRQHREQTLQKLMDFCSL